MTSRELSIKYVGDASSLQRTLASIDKAHASLASKLQSVGKSLSSAGSTMTRSFTLPIVAGFAVAINEATEFAQVQAQTAAALKSTGGAAGVTAQHIVDLSARIGKLSAQDGELVQAGENVLLSFTNISNEVGKGNNIFDRASIAAADLSARMGTDLQGAMVLVGKAVNDPIKGLSALTRVGVTFTDKQREMITRMVEAGDTMGAQKLILAELTKEFGGSAKAAGDAASPFTKLKLTFLDLAQSTGTILLPMVQKVGEVLAGLAARFDTLSPSVQRIIVVVGLVVAAIGPLLLITGKLVTVIGFLVSPIGLVIVAIAALVAAFVIAYNKSEEFRDIVNKAFAAVRDFIKAVLPPISAFIKAFIDKVVGFWQRFGDEIQEAVRIAFRFIVDGIKAALQVIQGILNVVLGILTLDWRQAWKGIQQIVGGVWDGIKNVVRTASDTVKNVLKTALDVTGVVWEKAWGAMKAFFSGIWAGIMSVLRGSVNGMITTLNVLISGLNRVHDAMALANPVGGAGWNRIAPIPGLAHGTPNFAGGLALVGEHGPELVGLPRGSSVMPAAQTSRALGGGTVVNITVNVQGSVVAERDLAETLRRELLQLGGSRRGRNPSVGLA